MSILWKIALIAVGTWIGASLLSTPSSPQVQTNPDPLEIISSPIQSEYTKEYSDQTIIHTSDGYINSRGNYVPSPAYSNTVPRGASAQCNDGTYSFSQSRRGTCSHHGGVASWL